ncbi:ATP-dependent DNA helicase RecG [Flavicella sediminum]|uniref:ATP-dependent DNA helicase RecG n=1 Tax=Flavicella sediminum TaxID=2585141 RepID=UPI00112154F4|nr:ATP-dependent DNA helicase RecG [Flavicella sediminum]
MSSPKTQISIAYLKGVGPARGQLLASELKLREIKDLFAFFPNRYIDKTKFYKVNELNENSSEVQIIGKIIGLTTVKQKNGSRLVAKFADATGTIELVWFKGAKWIKDSIVLNELYVVFGKVNDFKGKKSIAHPELELKSVYESGIKKAIQPIYPSTEKLSNRGVSNRVMSKIFEELFLAYYSQIPESLSQTIIEKHGLISKKEALLHIHFPKNQEMLTKASNRLKFEELFFIQLQLVRKKVVRKNKIVGFKFPAIGAFFNDFYNSKLSFELTGAQKRVLKEIRNDMRSGTHMNRLLQGDVGSGKTIVALLTMLMAIDNGFQAALIAPTSILANQHFTSINASLDGMGIKVSLLTGSSKVKERKEIHAGLEDGTLHILIGTHAILEDKVKFKNLGLSVIDEQHRFGVAQRMKMWLKNTNPPHVLVMTATPIPRTLAMSVYGDLDISVIDELPPGRKEIQTVHRYDKNRLAVFKFMRDEIEKGRQVYIVYPLIEGSEKMDYKDLMDGYESIVREFPSPKYQLSIVHGKMKPVDKDFEMDRFVRGDTQIMVATTVIEVGVNVPNASIMIVESAERFGLSQLHQLRGRVGRGAEQSYCVLMTSFKLSQDAKTRLETMVTTSDGFKIAEVDLKLRGPGNIMGTQQSGVLNLRIADISKDGPLLEAARQEAHSLLSEDPNLLKQENAPLAKAYQEIAKNTSIWANIS